MVGYFGIDNRGYILFGLIVLDYIQFLDREYIYK